MPSPRILTLADGDATPSLDTKTLPLENVEDMSSYKPWYLRVIY